MRVKVIVKFGKQENIEEEDEKLVLKLTTRPEKGRANKKLIELLAEYFKIPKSKIKIAQGLKNREKVIEIEKQD